MPHVEAWETAGRMPKAIFRRMGELGFLGLEYDERYGGAGADVMMTAVLHEECARSRSGSFAMAVGVHCDMASPHLYWTGSEALKETYLPAICRGEKLTAIAVTEPGGENVYPAEVETVIVQLDGVTGVCVYGVPDVKWGEAIKAVVEVKAAGRYTAQQVTDFVGGKIARFKRPHVVVFTDALPRTAEGAVDRDAVKAKFGATA